MRYVRCKGSCPCDAVAAQFGSSFLGLGACGRIFRVFYPVGDSIVSRMTGLREKVMSIFRAFSFAH